MTKEQRDWFASHHRSADELLAAYLEHHPNAWPSKIGVLDLIGWAYEQSLVPATNKPVS